MFKRTVALLSIILFAAAVLIYLWWGRFQYHHSLFLSATFLFSIFILLCNQVYFGDSRRQLGLRLDNARAAFFGYGGLILVGLILLLPAGWLLGSPEVPQARSIFYYFLWAGAQQYLLQNLLRLRSQNVFDIDSHPFAGRLISSAVAAALFGAFHWPNVTLATLTFAAGLAWCLLFTYVPNFFWAWGTQGVLAITLAIFFKAGPLDQFQVGRPGYRYEYFGGGALVAGGYDSQGRPVVVTLPGHDLGMPARVRVFDPSGTLRSEWIAFQDLDFSGRISVGELGFAPGDEVAVTPGPAPGNPPEVRIFDLTGRLLSEFLPKELPSGYGASVAIGCGNIYLAPGAGPTAPKEVFEFSPRGKLLRNWSFPDLPLHNGLKATMICEDRKKGSDADQKETLLLWGTEIAVNPATIFALSPPQEVPEAWEAFQTTFGVQLIPVTVGDGESGIALSLGPLTGYPPLVRVLGLSNEPIHEFVGYEDDQACGSNLGAVDIDADGRDEVILGEGVCPGRLPTVRILRLNGTPVSQWQAY